MSYTISVLRGGARITFDPIGDRAEAIAKAWWHRQWRRLDRTVLLDLPDGRELPINPQWSMLDIFEAITGISALPPARLCRVVPVN